MPAKQTLLFPDPRPLVERFGTEFFRRLPSCPGVYLMRDARESVLYVGKARNLRQRLNSYRVANPERLRPRHLRLLRAVVRIEWEECADESSALLREAALLRELQPPFNRAGTWPPPPRYLAWRMSEHTLELGLFESTEASWASHGPLGGGARHTYATLVRVLWLGLNPARTVADLPHGWFCDEPTPAVLLTLAGGQGSEILSLLDMLLGGDAAPLRAWVEGRASTHPFDRTMLAEDLESLCRRFQPKNAAARNHSQR
jgi:predicted GIY-YIG superfamily endonuclease